MVAQQVHRLVNELGLVLQAGGLITPAQLLQNLLSCRLTHVFIHSGQGNPTFGTTYRLTALSTPSRVTKLLAQFVTWSPDSSLFTNGVAAVVSSADGAVLIAATGSGSPTHGPVGSIYIKRSVQ